MPRKHVRPLHPRPRLFADLAIAHGDARYARLLRSLARVKLLILDDWGPEALTPNQARDLLEIVEDRYDKGSLIITSQVPVDRWHDLIGVPTLADAILDRVIHNAYRIDLAGESLRKRRPRHEIDLRAKAGSPDPRRGKAADNGGLRYGAMESALRPPLPTATRALAEIQIQARLTNGSGQNIIPSIRGSRRQVADIKSESRPASNRNRWPASYRNAWPASSESAREAYCLGLTSPLVASHTRVDLGLGAAFTVTRSTRRQDRQGDNHRSNSAKPNQHIVSARAYRSGRDPPQ